MGNLPAAAVWPVSRDPKRVAYRREDREFASPLDSLCGKVPLPSTKDSPEPVGQVQSRLKPRSERLAANVALTILGGPHPVQFDGIVALAARPGWIVLDVRPLEAWAEPFRCRCRSLSLRFWTTACGVSLLLGDFRSEEEIDG